MGRDDPRRPVRHRRAGRHDRPRPRQPVHDGSARDRHGRHRRGHGPGGHQLEGRPGRRPGRGAGQQARFRRHRQHRRRRELRQGHPPPRSHFVLHALEREDAPDRRPRGPVGRPHGPRLVDRRIRRTRRRPHQHRPARRDGLGGRPLRRIVEPAGTRGLLRLRHQGRLREGCGAPARRSRWRLGRRSHPSRRGFLGRGGRRRDRIRASQAYGRGRRRGDRGGVLPLRGRGRRRARDLGRGGSGLRGGRGDRRERGRRASGRDRGGVGRDRRRTGAGTRAGTRDGTRAASPSSHGRRADRGGHPRRGRQQLGGQARARAGTGAGAREPETEPETKPEGVVYVYVDDDGVEHEVGADELEEFEVVDEPDSDVDGEGKP